MKRETAHNEDERKINLVLINDFMINKDCQWSLCNVYTRL
jgi:hypothetical protein